MSNPPQQPHSSNPPTPKSKADLSRIIVAIVIGNGFVTYDFTVYSFSAALIGRLFFPAANPLSSLLLSLGTFGAGFVMRPVGAYLIGRIADRQGRRAGMIVALALMTAGTWTIACLPSYQTIGAAATWLMVTARLLQGLAAGGEIGPASASLMESVPYRLRCFMVSWRGASQGAAACVAALVGALTSWGLSAEQMHAWGWRIPFMLGGLIGPVGWYLRRRMQGEPVPSNAAAGAPAQGPFEGGIRPLVYGVLMMAATSTSIYLAVFYMPGYLVHTLHRPAPISLFTACLSGFVIFVMSPLVGVLADRFESRKPLQYAGLFACLVATWPAFTALTHGAGTVASVAIITGYVALALNNAGPNSVMVLEAFPPHRRAAALAVIYGVGVVLFGGFTPFIVTWLIARTGDAMMPAWYLLGATVLTLFALYRFPERDGRAGEWGAAVR